MTQTAHAADSGAEIGLDEIIVTAQRKTESSQKAAIALNVVTTDDLANAGITNVSNLNAAAPSLNATQSGGGNTSYFVRGVGNFTNNAYSDPAIAFNYDGIYIGRPTAQNGAFFDIERIEILKGPQGTLYGRNATGGAINVLPNKPHIGENTASGSVTLGNYSLVDADAMGNIALGYASAVRLAAKVVRRDGYYSDGSSDDRSEGVRLQFLTKLADQLTLRIGADYTHKGGNSDGYSYIGNYTPSPTAVTASATAPRFYTFTPANVGAFSGLHSPEDKAYFSKLIIANSWNHPDGLLDQSTDDKVTGVNAELVANTSVGDVTLISAYRDLSLDDIFTGPTFKAGLVKESNRQFSNELRLNGTRIGPLDWILGLYYYDETDNGQYTYNQFFTASFQKFTTNTNSRAVFGRFTFNVSDRLRFVAATRYTADRKTFDGGATTLLNICTTANPNIGVFCFNGPNFPLARTLAETAALTPASLLPFGFPLQPGDVRPFGNTGNILTVTKTSINHQKSPTSRVTYRLATEFDVAGQSLLYASYETGFRSGGFSLTKGFETFQPEYLTASTLGSKNRFLNDRLQLNAELFYWRYTNQQISHFGPDSDGNPAFLTDNAGKSTIKGVDVDVKFRATASTLLSASVQYLKNTMDEFTYDQPLLNNGTPLPPPATGCSFSTAVNRSNTPVYRIDCAGKTGVNSPEWSVNAGIEQSVPVGDLNFSFRLDGRYRGNRTLGFEFLPQQESGSDVTVDAGITLENLKNTWSVKLWGHNVTNETALSVVQFNSAVGGAIIGTDFPPATYGVTAAYKFQ